jgi:RNA polymerase sigma-70 factor (ECF subfamily)
MLDTSEDAVRGALKRARETLERRLPAAGTEPAPAPASGRERELVQRFADAWETDDIDEIVAMLTDDAWLRMPPSPLEYQGLVAADAFLRATVAWRSAQQQRHRLVATRANTQPAFGVYRTDPRAPIAHATGLMVLTLQGTRIAAISNFLDAGVRPRFGLPETLGM